MHENSLLPHTQFKVLQITKRLPSYTLSTKSGWEVPMSSLVDPSKSAIFIVQLKGAVEVGDAGLDLFKFKNSPKGLSWFLCSISMGNS